MLITLEDIKSQLRLEADYSEEDQYLALIGKAAESRMSEYLNRNIYVEGTTIPPTDPDGMIIPASLRLALLLLVTHFYENRSAVSEVEMVELPMAFTWLARPHRIYPQ
ncbi:head-tail connector protein [Scandinavium sp. H11S7]|uniref:Head-tail connector protein n=1 Tax=Scandinavium hiltneri TaxID=2926519 RepID=A0ABT2E514_9ENTR|nr:head-tail connector protein [Scandinavium hiltneri]MCS2162968.1 head-tail connector protein [Scandinavium hiltneri]